MEFGLAFVWLAGAIVNTCIADERGRSGVAAFFLSIIASPLLVWAFLIATPMGEKAAVGGSRNVISPADREAMLRKEVRGIGGRMP